MSTATPSRRGPGRPPAATREDVIAAALHRYLRGHRVDVQAIAAELGLGRATIYRWYGSREGLLAEVLFRAAEPLLDDARSRARGKGRAALLRTFDRFNRSLAASPALRRFVEDEPEVALRIITSGGTLEPRIVAMVAALIEAEARSGAYEPPVEPSTMAYAVVRLAEAFLFNDTVAGIRGDVDLLRDIQAALLGVDGPLVAAVEDSEPDP
jgi:AcrR family transcriptional regulator